MKRAVRGIGSTERGHVVRRRRDRVSSSPIRARDPGRPRASAGRTWTDRHGISRSRPNPADHQEMPGRHLRRVCRCVPRTRDQRLSSSSRPRRTRSRIIAGTVRSSRSATACRRFMSSGGNPTFTRASIRTAAGGRPGRRPGPSRRPVPLAMLALCQGVPGRVKVVHNTIARYFTCFYILPRMKHREILTWQDS